MLLKTHGVVCFICSRLRVGEKCGGKGGEKKQRGFLSPCSFCFLFHSPGNNRATILEHCWYMWLATLQAREHFSHLADGVWWFAQGSQVWSHRTRIWVCWVPKPELSSNPYLTAHIPAFTWLLEKQLNPRPTSSYSWLQWMWEPTAIQCTGVLGRLEHKWLLPLSAALWPWVDWPTQSRGPWPLDIHFFLCKQ